LENVKSKVLWSGDASKIGYLMNLSDDVTSFKFLICTTAFGVCFLHKQTKSDTVYYVGAGVGLDINFRPSTNHTEVATGAVVLEEISNTQLKVRASGFVETILMDNILDTTETSQLTSGITLHPNSTFYTPRSLYSIMAIKMF
jgi:hypothetical protein